MCQVQPVQEGGMQQRENKRQRDEATEERERETEQQRVRPPFIKTKARRLREAFVRVAVVDVLWPESGLLNDSSHEQEEALATTAHICQPTSIERCLSFPPGLAQTGLLVKRQRAGVCVSRCIPASLPRCHCGVTRQQGKRCPTTCATC